MMTSTRASSSYRERRKYNNKVLMVTACLYIIYVKDACECKYMCICIQYCSVCNYGYHVIGVNGFTEQSDNRHISILSYRGNKLHQLGVSIGKVVTTQ